MKNLPKERKEIRESKQKMTFFEEENQYYNQLMQTWRGLYDVYPDQPV